jgi:hypothetical protein
VSVAEKLSRDFKGRARLSDSAGAGDRCESMRVQERLDRRDLFVPAYKRRQSRG